MTVALTQQDIGNLKAQGFSDLEIQKAIDEIEQEEIMQSYGNVQAGKKNDPRQNAQHSAFATRQDENLIRWQLELNDILERAEHVLRGDIVTFKNGQLVWDKNPFPKDNTLNEFGVQLIMKIISTYINRNTILSDYTNDEINFKVFDFGRELNNLLFMKYETMGLDNEEKRKEYPMIVREVVDLVHSAYKRALMGGERRSLREMISVSQSHQTAGYGTGGVVVNAQGTAQQQRGLLNPMRYIKGRYA
jgi:hypothetical protein